MILHFIHLLMLLNACFLLLYIYIRSTESQLLRENYALIEVMQKKEPNGLPFNGQSHLCVPHLIIQLLHLPNACFFLPIPIKTKNLDNLSRSKAFMW